jgi:hypothetical protein
MQGHDSIHLGTSFKKLVAMYLSTGICSFANKYDWTTCPTFLLRANPEDLKDQHWIRDGQQKTRLKVL